MPLLLYTFCVNFRSGTYLSQNEAKTPELALRAWVDDPDEEMIAALDLRDGVESWGESLKDKLELWNISDVIVPIRGLKNCWSVHFLQEDEGVFVDIIQTDARS
ncbi:hypothetical protein [Sphingomonas sp.]|uniref:hypothetical protein n=1 Tax=Sphingomonas sp. TaxID=28214 RepID=UPI003D6CAB06